LKGRCAQQEIVKTSLSDDYDQLEKSLNCIERAGTLYIKTGRGNSSGMLRRQPVQVYFSSRML